MADTGYCVKCRATREIKNSRVVTGAKSASLRGTCGSCGTKMVRFMKRAPAKTAIRGNARRPSTAKRKRR